MKFVTFASLAVAVNSQDLVTPIPGGLYYHWNEDMLCPDVFLEGTLIESIKIEGGGS